MTVIEAIDRGLISKDGIENEMSWLRCIDMNNDDDVRRAATEIQMSIIKDTPTN